VAIQGRAASAFRVALDRHAAKWRLAMTILSLQTQRSS